MKDEDGDGQQQQPEVSSKIIDGRRRERVEISGALNLTEKHQFRADNFKENKERKKEEKKKGKLVDDSIDTKSDAVKGKQQKAEQKKKREKEEKKKKESSNARLGEVPWQVLLEDKESGGGGGICGGTILNLLFILTSAKCIETFKKDDAKLTSLNGRVQLFTHNIFCHFRTFQCDSKAHICFP